VSHKARTYGTVADDGELHRFADTESTTHHEKGLDAAAIVVGTGGRHSLGRATPNLSLLGIKTVVNLRSFHSDAGMMGKTIINYEPIPMDAWHPEEEEVVRFLRIVADPKRLPVLVHCQHGADRTGTMCALYRIAVQGWSKEEALREMQEGGFGFHGVWQNLIRYINGLDIERIKQKAGIKSPAASPG
jgi:protein tyrosine phosphatase (PTP) superfamily phosphohydrolase (DUF442 family)